MKVSPDGLSWQQWVICVAIGLSTWIYSFVLRLLPDTICPMFGTKKPTKEEVLFSDLGHETPRNSNGGSLQKKP